MFVGVSQRERREKRSQQPACDDASAVALGLGDWKTGGGGRSVSPQPEPKQAQSSHTLSLRHSMHRPLYSSLCLRPPLSASPPTCPCEGSLFGLVDSTHHTALCRAPAAAIYVEDRLT